MYNRERIKLSRTGKNGVKKMLGYLLNSEISKRNVSLRVAAQEIGTSHTTISRIIKGDNKLDLNTISKVCEWLKIEPSIVLNEEVSSNLGNRIALLVQNEPKLKDLFERLLTDIDGNEISVSDAQDILEYAAYRLSKRAVSEKK